MIGFETILPFLRPIEHLIMDDTISEIMVNGSDRVFIERAGVLQEVPDLKLSEKSLMVAVKNIARRLGDDISEQKPILDSRLPDGSRVAAVIPPCSIHGVTLTIRKFNSRHFTMEDLVRHGSLDEALALRLKTYVEDRQNILISGGTGTGKTTLATALGRFISDSDRILLIEDTSEIQLDKPNLVRFEARQAQSDLTGRHDQGSIEGVSSPPARSHHPRRDSRRRSLRPLATLEHRPLRYAFDGSCKLGSTSDC